MQGEVLETKYANYRIIDGIMHIVYPSDLVIYIEVAKDIVKNRLLFSNGTAMPLFFDIRGIAFIDGASRKYFTTPEALHNVPAGAFLINSLVSRLAGNIFIRIDKPIVPTKLFTDEKKALKWLKKFK